MEKILAQRYAFCDFSKIVGFPNPLPSRDEWESSLPKFQGEEWEVPAEHLLDFHDFIHQLHIVHEDVQINIFRYSLEGIARDWCRSLPIASIISLTGFHAAFNSFCKEYFSVERLFEGCCDEFSLLHKDSSSHESLICDEAFIVEENIYHEDHEVLNDIHYDSNNTETSGIISDVSVVLNIHEDQHVSSEYSDVEEQVYSAVDISPDYEAEIDDKLVKKTREDSSLFFPSFSELKADFVCCSYEENAEDISVLETNVFGSPDYDEEVVSNTDQKQPIFDEYPSEDDKEQSFFMASLEPRSMVPVYDDYESDPWEGHEGEKEELNVQLISCPTLVNEKISPGISQPASILYPPVHSENTKQQVSNNEVKEVISYQFSMPYYKFYDPVGLYMELSFPKALEPAKLFILSSFGGIVSVPKHVFILLSYFPYLLWIICSEKKNYVTKQFGWLWWKFVFT
jgi:hypothetical protein